MIFKVSPQELKIISQEVNSSIDEEIFKQIYLTAIDERPFNFLYIDIRKQNYYSGFKKNLIVYQSNVFISTDSKKN